MKNEEAIREKYLRLNKTKLQTAKFISVLMIAAALFLSLYVFDTPQKTDKSRAVYDEAEILSDTTIQKINERASAITELTGGKAKIAVFTEEEKSSQRELEKKAEKLFKSHEIGDDGMLFLVYVQRSSGGFGENIGNFIGGLFGGENRPYAYYKGRNVDYIPDSEIKRILEINFDGIEKEDFDPGAAFLAAYDALADLFDAHYGLNSQIEAPPEAPEAPKAPKAPEPPALPEPDAKKTVQVVVGTVALFVLLFFILGIFTGKKNSGPSRVYKKPFWFGLIG